MVQLSSDPISLLVHDTHKKSTATSTVPYGVSISHRGKVTFTVKDTYKAKSSHAHIISIIIIAFRKRGNPERVMIADVMLIGEFFELLGIQRCALRC